MGAFNHIVLLGKLVIDPELKYVNGIPVCRLRLVVPRWYKAKDGQRKSDSLFIDANVWRRTAELCAQRLLKGSQVMVTGRLQLNQWQDKDGQSRQTYRVQCQQVHFVDPPAGAEAPPADASDADSEAA